MVFVIVLVVLAIQIAIAFKFGSIAEEKGYSAGRYIAWCIFFGVVGYCMVAALPDLELRNALLRQVPQKRGRDIVLDSGDWKCGSCGSINSKNYGQCKKCGQFRG